MSSRVIPVMGSIQILIRYHAEITELDDWKWDSESFISNYDHLNSPAKLDRESVYFTSCRQSKTNLR